MENLIDRVVDKVTPRSTQEAIAMAKVRDAMAKAEVLWERGWGPRSSRPSPYLAGEEALQ